MTLLVSQMVLVTSVDTIEKKMPFNFTQDVNLRLIDQTLHT